MTETQQNITFWSTYQNAKKSHHSVKKIAAQPEDVLDPFPFHSLVLYFDKTYQPILPISKSKQIKATFYIVLKIEDIRSNIAILRVPERKSTRWPLLRH